MLESTSLPRFITHGTSNINWQKQLYQCVVILFLPTPPLISTLEQLRCWFHSLFHFHIHIHNAHHDCKYLPQTSQPRMEAFRCTLVFHWHHNHIFIISGVRSSTEF